MSVNMYSNLEVLVVEEDELLGDVAAHVNEVTCSYLPLFLLISRNIHEIVFLLNKIQESWKLIYLLTFRFWVVFMKY